MSHAHQPVPLRPGHHRLRARTCRGRPAVGQHARPLRPALLDHGRLVGHVDLPPRARSPSSCCGCSRSSASPSSPTASPSWPAPSAGTRAGVRAGRAQPAHPAGAGRRRAQRRHHGRPPAGRGHRGALAPPRVGRGALRAGRVHQGARGHRHRLRRPGTGPGPSPTGAGGPACSCAPACVTVAVMGGLSLVSGLGWGWVANLGTPGTVRSWMAPATAVGLLVSGTAHLFGIGVGLGGVLTVTRAIGLLGAAVHRGLVPAPPRAHRHPRRPRRHDDGLRPPRSGRAALVPDLGDHHRGAGRHRPLALRRARPVHRDAVHRADRRHRAAQRAGAHRPAPHGAGRHGAGRRGHRAARAAGPTRGGSTAPAWAALPVAPAPGRRAAESSA